MPIMLHGTDKAGRPLLIVRIGKFQIKELFKFTNQSGITTFMIREIDSIFHRRFPDSLADQIRVIFDIKGVTFKLLTNKHINLVWKEIIEELSKQFPELAYSIHVLNAPFFF